MDDLEILLSRAGLKVSKEDMAQVRKLFEHFKGSLDRLYSVDLEEVELTTVPPLDTDSGEQRP